MKLLFLFLFVLFSSLLVAQTDEPTDIPRFTNQRFNGLSLGYSYQFHDSITMPPRTKKHYFDIEYYRNKMLVGGHHPMGWGYSIGNSFGFINYDHFTIAPNVSASATLSLVNFGSEMVYYTDFKGHSWVVSPFVGVGAEGASFQLKYNAVIDKYEFEPINNTTLSITVPLRVLKG